MKPISPPARKELRGFGFSLVAGVTIAFGIVIPFLADSEYRAWPWMAGAALLTLTFGAPWALAPAYRPWMALSRVLGKVNSWLVLSVLFLGVLFPIAMVLRATGWDRLGRRFDRAALSYRVNSSPQGSSPPRQHMEKPF